MSKTTLFQRLRYAFDNTMSRGTPAIIAWLGVLSLAIVTLAGAVLAITGITPAGGEPLNFLEGTWLSLMRTLDAGTMGGDEGWGFRIVAFAVTLGGVFVISTLIGALSSGIEAKLDELRKGRSLVCESGHTLILGWSSKVATLISELVVANANQRRPRIVVLANKDKVEMEEEIATLVPRTGRTRIICRSGDPDSMQDLALVRPYEARSILVLGPEDESEAMADAHSIKVILALTNNPARKGEHLHIVAEIRDPANLDVARIVSKDEAQLILTDDLVARIMVQTSRQSGLSVVYQELLDFDGAEIYFQEEPALAGKPFATALLAYEDSSVMGLQTRDGKVRLNPPSDTLIQPGDKIIAITEDDDTMIVREGPAPQIDTAAIYDGELPPRQAEKTLLLGWNRRVHRILVELDHYVQPGSKAVILATSPEASADVATLRHQLRRLDLDFHHADPACRAELERVDPFAFDHVMVLAPTEEDDKRHADNRVLMTLLHLRHLQELRGVDLSVVTEMMDSRNRELAEVTKADDFIVSDRLISLLMSQVSENKALMQVFEELFAANGCEIYLKPAGQYIKAGSSVNFATVVEAARRRGEIAIGYRQMSRAFDAQAAYGVRVNPAKSSTVTLGTRDMVIVIAEG